MLKRRLLTSSAKERLLPPVFNPEGGIYQGSSKRVSLINPNQDQAGEYSYIRYMVGKNTVPLDETTGSIYSQGGITVYAPGNIVQAMCVSTSPFYLHSEVVSEDYIITDKPLLAPRISPQSGTTSNTAITFQLISDNENPDIKIFYSIGEDSIPLPDAQGISYSSPVTLTDPGTYCVKAICKEPLTSCYSDITTAIYTITETEPDIPEPFDDNGDALIAVRMYLTAGEENNIISSYYDYENSPVGIIRISNRQSQTVLENNTFNTVFNLGGNSTWNGKYTPSVTGFYFVMVRFPGITYIPSRLFAETSVTNLVYIGNSVEQIGTPTEDEMMDSNVWSDKPGVFFGCIGLNSIILDRATYTNYDLSYENNKMSSHLTTIGNATFFRCRNVEEISFCDGIEYLAAYSFCLFGVNSTENRWINYNLNEVFLPKDLKGIGALAFSTIGSIQDYHLERCEKLNSIQSRAFDSNSLLNTITIPASVQFIAPIAFSSYQNNGEYRKNDCCSLVEVINYSNLDLSPSSNHSSGVSKFCLSYKTSGTSDLNPLIVPPDSSSPFKWLTKNSTLYLVGVYTNSLEIQFPEIESNYVINTGACAGQVSANFNSIIIPANVTELKPYSTTPYFGPFGLNHIVSKGVNAPTIYPNTFSGTCMNYGRLICPNNSSYDIWMSTEPDYLGSHSNWTRESL